MRSVHWPHSMHVLAWLALHGLSLLIVTHKLLLRTHLLHMHWMLHPRLIWNLKVWEVSKWK